MQLHYWQPPIAEAYTTASPDDLAAAITRRREELGDQLVILGHHYQTDEVIQHADFTGDSLKLSQLAAERVGAAGADTVICDDPLSPAQGRNIEKALNGIGVMDRSELFVSLNSYWRNG